MTDVAEDLAGLGAAVEWTDTEAAAQARAVDLTIGGRLADLAEWLAATQGQFPPTRPKQPRCVGLGTLPDNVWTIASELEIGIDTVDVPRRTSVSDALAAGIAAADERVDAGADLLVIADRDVSDEAAVLVGLLTAAEPVALLPRGSAAVETAAWIERAVTLRDTRRRVADSRTHPGRLLEALGYAPLAATVGLVMRAVVRRTPVVLDGVGAVAAALLCHDIQARAGRWWRLADVSPDPVHTLAAAELGQRPLLDLGTSGGDGTAGLLTLPLLAAAAQLAAQA